MQKWRYKPNPIKIWHWNGKVNKKTLQLRHDSLTFALNLIQSLWDSLWLLFDRPMVAIRYQHFTFILLLYDFYLISSLWFISYSYFILIANSFTNYQAENKAQRKASQDEPKGGILSSLWVLFYCHPTPSTFWSLFFIWLLFKNK